MIIFLLGYFVMGLIFLVWRVFYHALNKKKLLPALRSDLANLYAYDREIIISNPIKIKIIGAIIVIFIILTMMPIQIEIIDLCDCILSSIVYFLMVIIYAPQKKFDE